MANSNLSAAKRAKNDEFYTQYGDIEAEMNAYVEFNPDVFRGKTVLLPCDDPEWSNFTKYFASNFTRFGLKKLISTSYAKSAGSAMLTDIETGSPLFDAGKHGECGKLFVLEADADRSGAVDMDDVQFYGYLDGDGDFRSEEVTALRDEADIIVTNPPFSLFREFVAWLMEADKKFVILGNVNAVTYKEFFPLIKEGKVWPGTMFNKTMVFAMPDSYETKIDERDASGRKQGRVPAIAWYTNIDHVKRHEPLLLDTMEHNLKFNKKLRKKLEKDFGAVEYPHYDNYDAIEIPFTGAIPSDYAGVMGVPITFLDKYSPDQFEIVGFAGGWNGQSDLITRKYPAKQMQHDKNGRVHTVGKMNDGTPQIRLDGASSEVTYYTVDDGHCYMRTYGRILIRNKHPEK